MMSDELHELGRDNQSLLQRARISKLIKKFNLPPLNSASLLKKEPQAHRGDLSSSEADIDHKRSGASHISAQSELSQAKIDHGVSRKSSSYATGMQRQTTAKPEQAKPTPSEPQKKEMILINQQEESEMILRRMIDIDSSWGDMKPYAWDIFDRWPGADIASKMIELAYIHGKTSDLVELLDQLRVKNLAGYFSVSPELRQYIVLRLWQRGMEGVLNHYLHQKSFQGQLLRLEKLFIFWSLHGCADQEKAWKFLDKFEIDIIDAVKEFGAQLKLTHSFFLLEVGKLSLSQRKEGYARRYLEQISPNDREFKDSLELLLKCKVDLDANGHCIYGRRLYKEAEWRNRIALIRGFLQDVRMKNGVKHQERTALNQILLNPLKWLPESAEAWSHMSRLLVEFVSLEYLLPNLFQVYREYQSKFLSPIFEKALWEPLIHLNSTDQFKNKYWHGVSLLHKFVGNQFLNHQHLWDAKDSIEASVGGVYKGVSWSKLHQNLIVNVSRSNQLSESDRVDLLARIKIVGDYLDISTQDIQDYITVMESGDINVLDRLLKVACKRHDIELEQKLLQKKSELTHPTNTVIDRQWQISCAQKDNDFAWRAATVLHCRFALIPEVEQVWILSGEKKRDPGVRVIPDEDLHILFSGLDKDEKNLSEAILNVGAKIPELLSMVNRRVRLHKCARYSAVDPSLEEVISKLCWMHQGRRVYRCHPEIDLVEKPPYMSFLGDNKWTKISLIVADRLGISAWKWDVKWLHDELYGLASKVNKSGDAKVSGKVGKWLRSLSPLQRRAWRSLLNISGQMDQQRAVLALGKFVSRLSLLLYQHHVEALNSLIFSESPLPIKWDMEKFILSKEYSLYRAKHFTSSNFSIPKRLPCSAIVRSETVNSNSIL